MALCSTSAYINVRGKKKKKTLQQILVIIFNDTGKIMTQRHDVQMQC